MRPCKLALEDGSVFSGRAFGAEGTRSGEAVFNTAMTGYQEILTDPSYLGQIVTMTYPLVGNYGINDQDIESAKLHLSGLVIRELPPLYSHHHATRSLDCYLKANGVIGLAGVDTRALTRRLRDHGSLRAVLSTKQAGDASLCAQARALPLMAERNLAAQVAGQAAGAWECSAGARPKYHIVALDCGIKYNVLRALTRLGCEVVCLSGLSAPEQILEHQPQGVVVGNGPGDPAGVDQSIKSLRALIGQVPIFGICLGHQLIARALGADTYKLKFGHHGINHPVRNLASGQIEITSQNHGFAVDERSLSNVGAVATHTNLHDHTLEGFAHKTHPIMAVQYHPEAAPGPHDSQYLFGLFLEMIETGRVPDGLAPDQGR